MTPTRMTLAVQFVDAGDSLLDMVSAATEHVCGADNE